MGISNKYVVFYRQDEGPLEAGDQFTIDLGLTRTGYYVSGGYTASSTATWT